MVLVQPTDEDENSADEQPPIPQVQQPQAVPPQQMQPAIQPLQGNNPKTTEQLLEELKQMQQQQLQQNQQQQNQPNGQTAPLKPRIPQ
jgi:hypothetical protein